MFSVFHLCRPFPKERFNANVTAVEIQKMVKDGMYQEVAMVDVSDANVAFEATTHRIDWVNNPGVIVNVALHLCRPTTVGDFLLDEDTQELIIIASKPI